MDLGKPLHFLQTEIGLLLALHSIAAAHPKVATCASLNMQAHLGSKEAEILMVQFLGVTLAKGFLFLILVIRVVLFA